MSLIMVLTMMPMSAFADETISIKKLTVSQQEVKGDGSKVYLEKNEPLKIKLELAGLVQGARTTTGSNVTTSSEVSFILKAGSSKTEFGKDSYTKEGDTYTLNDIDGNKVEEGFNTLTLLIDGKKADSRKFEIVFYNTDLDKAIADLKYAHQEADILILNLGISTYDEEFDVNEKEELDKTLEQYSKFVKFIIMSEEEFRSEDNLHSKFGDESKEVSSMLQENKANKAEDYINATKDLRSIMNQVEENMVHGTKKNDIADNAIAALYSAAKMSYKLELAKTPLNAKRVDSLIDNVYTHYRNVWGLANTIGNKEGDLINLNQDSQVINDEPNKGKEEIENEIENLFEKLDASSRELNQVIEETEAILDELLSGGSTGEIIEIVDVDLDTLFFWQITQGTDLPLISLTYTVKYDNGDTEEFVATNDTFETDFDKNQLGEQEVTLTLKGTSVSTKINVTVIKDVEIVMSEILQEIQRIYYVGDKFNANNGKIKFLLTNNTIETINIADQTIHGFQSDKAGDYTIYFEYLGYNITFDITVLPRPSSGGGGGGGGGQSSVRPGTNDKKEDTNKTDTDNTDNDSTTDDSTNATPVETTVIKPGSNVATITDADGNTRTVTMDVPPTIKEGRTLMPARFIAEVLGATVDYNAQTKQATFGFNESTVVLTLGSKTMLVNDEAVTLLTAPEVVEGRVLLPIRDIQQALASLGLEANVDWNAETKEITIAKF